MSIWTSFSRKLIFCTALLIPIEPSDVEGILYCSSDEEDMMYCSVLVCCIGQLGLRPVSLLARELQTDCDQKFVRSDFTQVESMIRDRNDFVRASL